jgi:crotonobetainyl-CoA:carnitine CoA-transferase CaiB-like acyl-CoA transferase
VAQDTQREGHSGGPLVGLNVLDLTLARAGPTCTRHLADWGARVIRIEPPGPADALAATRKASDYQNLHRNKTIITLDLKSARGHEAFMKLAANADVIVENMRTPVKHNLKIAYEDVAPINPRLIYGSISGFGQSGPYMDRALVDQIAQGMGGLMNVTGEPGRGPMRAGAAISDMMAGTLCALGIALALYERERTGVGRYVHTSLIEAMIFTMDFQATRWLMDGEVPQPAGNQHPTVAPMSTFKSADGWVNLSASSPAQWRKLCDLLGKPEWVDRPGWKGTVERGKNKVELHAAIAEIIATKPTAYWVETLAPHGLPVGPIYGMDQTMNDIQVKHLGIAGDVRHPSGDGQTQMLNSPINLEGLKRTIRAPAPLGQGDTSDVLKALGYSEADIETMRKERVI